MFYGLSMNICLKPGLIVCSNSCSRWFGSQSFLEMYFVYDFWSLSVIYFKYSGSFERSFTILNCFFEDNWVSSILLYLFMITYSFCMGFSTSLVPINPVTLSPCHPVTLSPFYLAPCPLFTLSFYRLRHSKNVIDRWLDCGCHWIIIN